MRLGTPSHNDARMWRMLSWELPATELEALSRAWFPYRQCEYTGEYLVHLSTAAFIMRHQLFAGFIDETAGRQARAYIREAQCTFTQAKLKPLGQHDWGAYFKPAWKYRAYQAAGMERLYWRLMYFARGQLLADDTGLGKTAQAIGVMGRIRAEGYLGTSYGGAPPGQAGCVVVATTTSCRSQWADEIERFSAAPWRVAVGDGQGAERRAKLAAGADVYIVNYEMFYLPQYHETMAQLMACCRLLLLDETFKVKNPEAKTTQAVCRFRRGVPFALGFNATPIEAGLEDLYSLFNILDPAVIGGREGFEGRYVTRDDNGKAIAYRNLREFKTRVAGLYIRRMPEEVGEDLPQVNAVFRPLEMSKRQEAAYRAAAGEFVRDGSDGAVGISRLGAVIRAACAADIDDPASDSAKLEDLEEQLLGELRGHRLVVFSKSRRVAEFAYQRLARFRPMLIHGDTSPRDRDLARRRFESHDGVGTVLVGTEAMNRGLNLQAAGALVNLDLPWNAAQLRQRVGRIRRIGSDRASVLVINPVARFAGRPRARSCDDWFARLIASRRDIAERMFGSDGVDEVGAETLDLQALRDFVRAGLEAA